MVYWETFDVLESLVDGDAKLMLSAIRQYSQYSALPDFTGNTILSTLWLLIRPKLDADTERYERIREQRRCAINARWEKERQIAATDEYGSIQPYSNDTDEYGCIRNIPTTSATSDTTATPDTEIREKGIRREDAREKGLTLTSQPCASENEEFLFEEKRMAAIRKLEGDLKHGV